MVPNSKTSTNFMLRLRLNSCGFLQEEVHLNFHRTHRRKCVPSGEDQLTFTSLIFAQRRSRTHDKILESFRVRTFRSGNTHNREKNVYSYYIFIYLVLSGERCKTKDMIEEEFIPKQEEIQIYVFLRELRIFRY